MTIATVSVTSRRVKATAEIRHHVTAQMKAPDRVIAVEAGARRGPAGERGPIGPPGGIEAGSVIDGGNF